MGLLILLASFAITILVLLVWGFCAKRGAQAERQENPEGPNFDCQGYVGETRIGWMCSTDFCDEIGMHACTKAGMPEGNKIYDSLEELRKARSCVEECGYTKVLLVAIEVGRGETGEET